MKVVAEQAWFAARPSGTEDVYKVYAESFLGPEHLERTLAEAEGIVHDALEARRRMTPGRDWLASSPATGSRAWPARAGWAACTGPPRSR